MHVMARANMVKLGGRDRKIAEDRADACAKRVHQLVANVAADAAPTAAALPSQASAVCNQRQKEGAT